MNEGGEGWMRGGGVDEGERMKDREKRENKNRRIK